MLPTGLYNQTYAQDMAIVRTKLQWGLLICFIILLLTFPQYGSAHLDLAIMIAITLIAVHGVSLLTGFCGQISLGQAAFMAVGGYTSAVLTTDVGLSFWIALPCAGLMAAVIGLIFGLPALRVKGFYLAMATLAAQFIIIYLITVLDVTNGVYGMNVPPPKIGSFEFDTPGRYYYLAIIAAIIMTLIAKNITRTKVGNAFIAIRDNDLAAELMGVNPFLYKMIAFAVCSFFAGIAGSLLVHYIRFVHVDQFSLMDSIWFLGMIIIGGLGRTSGAVFGVVFLLVLGDITHELTPIISDAAPSLANDIAAAFGPLIKGLVIVLFLIFEPHGLAHRWEIFKTSYRLWPFPYSSSR